MPRFRGHFCNTSHGSQYQRWWRAGRGRGTEREPLRSCGAGFNPARASLHVLFYWKGDLDPRSRRERSHQPAEAETSTAGIALWRPRHSLSGGMGGTPDLRQFRTNRRVSVPITCFHVVPFISRGDFVFLIPSRANSSDNWVPSTIADATCCSFGGQAHPEGTWMGRRIDGFRPVLVSIPVAAATTALIGADTPRSFSRREGTIDSLIPVHQEMIDVTLSGNHASTGMLAEEGSERYCRVFSGRRFCPLPRFPVATFDMGRRIVDAPCFSAQSSNSRRVIHPP